ncbi:MAG: DUF6285 domain-containing protein [Thermus sp.]|uniref:DUF6285 domain-containing protein n=1 Tax=Thermus sp. TaxID=275 RepID=UPI0025F22DB7|nr:DUF6285 domain-containing protein [Thermus sp.]MCS6868956.1 DUF6285 domain-containing protein [Thermus sp.]MCS7219220.1 DUF6285 domain-containing protein [Thermus sp.]MCX7850446.1 DUF6285 domain-containing protein [Thermus sp.]MDW8358643.1 DUF6285 domain-containing protein [Thermus sp.]MDW8358843.1 DUF6285 domain-containing protein [Thermus sp.]
MDRPNLDELLEAVAEFLKGEVLPTLEDPRLHFQALVALNALGIARREVALGKALEAEDLGELGRLLGREGDREGLLRELAQRIRRGEAPEGTFSFLKAHVARKLRIASPKHLERYP